MAAIIDLPPYSPELNPCAPIALGESTVHECPQCVGLWVDVETFQEICADREQQAAVLGGAAPYPSPCRSTPPSPTCATAPAPSAAR